MVLRYFVGWKRFILTYCPAPTYIQMNRREDRRRDIIYWRTCGNTQRNCVQSFGHKRQERHPRLIPSIATEATPNSKSPRIRSAEAPISIQVQNIYT